MQEASARVVESEVTSKLEGILARIRGVKEIKSTSSNGSGSITIGFDKHTNMQQARFEVSANIRQTWQELPDGVSYPVVTEVRTIDRSAEPILTYIVNAPGTDLAIKQFAEEKIRPAVGPLPGVNRVSIDGAMPMEWRLIYNSSQLRSLGLTPEDITSALLEQRASQFLGMTMTNNGEWLTVSSTLNDNRDFDISGIYVTTPDSVILSLDQLVKAKHIEARPTGYFRINGLNTIHCTIYADDAANQLELAGIIKSTINNIALTQDYSIILSNDATEKISTELDKIYFRTGLTLVILLLFVALVSMNLRYMLVIALSVVFTLCVSMIFYWLLDIEIQLYSLAGITISLNLIIDNIIVTGDHYRRLHNRRMFTSVLTATLTTIGALSIVLFLDEDLRLNLQDFVAVVFINLSVSLAASLWLVPALIDRIGLRLPSQSHRYRRLRLLARFNRLYTAYIRVGHLRRWIILPTAMLAFGFPVFMIPKEICPDTYNEAFRPWVDRIFGGTLRLFVDKVHKGGYFNRNDSEPTLEISATLPNGATLDQMNTLVKKMEMFLSDFEGISQFRTDIYSPRQAYISVSFTRDGVRHGLPYRLKTEVIGKALTLGSGNWTVYGLEDMGFSNAVTMSGGSFRVKLTGFNYDELEAIAERFRRKLLTHRRIKEVNISPEFSWHKDDYTEFYLDIDRDAMARQGVGVGELYDALSPVFGRDLYCGTTAVNAERIFLSSRQSDEYDVWGMMNNPFTAGRKRFKLSDFASVAQTTAPRSVVKENQQYILCIQYDYIGPYSQGYKLLEKDIEEFRPTLPLGYTIEDMQQSHNWWNSSPSEYWLLFIAVAIIFLIIAIFFNSLRQPLEIILTIPLSFIGVFLAFYLTGMSFDQGGFASFVLLTGITVNAAIYLISEYKRTGNYIRAFNAKIIPIFLTVVSTILGFIPFMVGPDAPEPFWFPLALGTIGGLATSIPTIILLLPLMIGQHVGGDKNMFSKNSHRG